jgi:hypothetical protein
LATHLYLFGRKVFLLVKRKAALLPLSPRRTQARLKPLLNSIRLRGLTLQPVVQFFTGDLSVLIRETFFGTVSHPRLTTRRQYAQRRIATDIRSQNHLNAPPSLWRRINLDMLRFSRPAAAGPAAHLDRNESHVSYGTGHWVDL